MDRWLRYGTDLMAAYHQVGVYAARILKGEKIPPDCAAHQVELIINLKSAKAIWLLGLKCRLFSSRKPLR